MAYVAERNPAAAPIIVEQFKVAQRDLVQFPGVAQVGLIPGTRRLVVGDYIPTVRDNRGEAEIVAIRTGRQNDAYALEYEAADVEPYRRPCLLPKNCFGSKHGGKRGEQDRAAYSAAAARRPASRWVRARFSSSARRKASSSDWLAFRRGSQAVW